MKWITWLSFTYFDKVLKDLEKEIFAKTKFCALLLKKSARVTEHCSANNWNSHAADSKSWEMWSSLQQSCNGDSWQQYLTKQFYKRLLQKANCPTNCKKMTRCTAKKIKKKTERQRRLDKGQSCPMSKFKRLIMCNIDQLPKSLKYLSSHSHQNCILISSSCTIAFCFAQMEEVKLQL